MRLLQWSLILFSATILGCSGSSDDKKGGGGGDGDLTDYSLCDTNAGPVDGGPSNSGLTLTSYRWYNKSKSDGIEVELILDFNYQRLNMDAICTYGGMETSTWVSSPVRTSRNQIEILQKAENSSEITVGDRRIRCSIDLEPMTLNYSFQGNCLKLKDGREDILFPAYELLD